MDFAELLQDSALLFGLGISFLGGMVAFFSPCVLPLLPGYLSIMSGFSVSEIESGEASPRQMLRATVLFVLGFTAVFVSLGAAATALGSVLLENLSALTKIAGWFVIGFGVLVLWGALSNSPLLRGAMRERRVNVRNEKLGAFAPPVMGLAFGFGWTPCIGPILGVILTLASAQGSVVQGMAMLAAFSCGIGVWFVLAGLGVSKLFKRMRKHLRTINLASGALVIAFGIIMVSGRIGQLSGYVSDFFIKIGLDALTQI
jgi:cytochrome c-type biogenesis protein